MRNEILPFDPHLFSILITEQWTIVSLSGPQQHSLPARYGSEFGCIEIKTPASHQPDVIIKDFPGLAVD